MGNSPLVFLGGQSYRRDCGRQQGLPVGRRPLLPLTLHPTGQDMIRSGTFMWTVAFAPATASTPTTATGVRSGTESTARRGQLPDHQL
jgi:hypothetical protein